MIAGVTLIGSGAASGKEKTSQDEAILRECDRYNLDYLQTLRSLGGAEGDGQTDCSPLVGLSHHDRCGWFLCLVCSQRHGAAHESDPLWIGILGAASLALLAAGVIRSMAHYRILLSNPLLILS